MSLVSANALLYAELLSAKAHSSMVFLYRVLSAEPTPPSSSSAEYSFSAEL